MKKTGKPVKKITISLVKQKLLAYNGEDKFLDIPCVSGDAAHPTPKGKFKVLEKHLIYRSKTYDAQMNYALRLTTSGIFIHEGYNFIEDPAKQNIIATIVSDTLAGTVSTGRALFPSLAEKKINLGNINLTGSHGCIRLRHSDARKLFDWAEKGTLVEVQ